MNSDGKKYYGNDILYNNGFNELYKYDELLENLMKNISIFAIEERKRYYEFYINNSHLFREIQEMYKNDYTKDSYELIMDNNCEWTKYNLLPMEMELKIMQKAFLSEVSTLAYVKNQNTNEILKKEYREQVHWFMDKLNTIFESRHNYNPQYFNEVEEKHFLKKELKGYSHSRRISNIYNKMLNCLSKIIDIINRGHCYFYELSLSIDMAFGQSCLKDIYMKKYNEIRDNYFQEVSALIHKYTDNLLTI